jgi:hypothetical protein
MNCITNNKAVCSAVKLTYQVDKGIKKRECKEVHNREFSDITFYDKAKAN